MLCVSHVSVILQQAKLDIKYLHRTLLVIVLFLNDSLKDVGDAPAWKMTLPHCNLIDSFENISENTAEIESESYYTMLLTDKPVKTWRSYVNAVLCQLIYIYLAKSVMEITGFKILMAFTL